MRLATAAKPACESYEFRERETSARACTDGVSRVTQRGSGTRSVDPKSVDHPRVLARVQRFLRSRHVLQALDMTTSAKYEFLQALYEALPPTFAAHAKVQFCDPTGADAVAAAVKLFTTSTGRRNVIAFPGADHGMTGGLPPHMHCLPCPYPDRFPFGPRGDRGWHVGLSGIAQVLSDPESAISKPAAVIVEAVQGEGQVIPAPAGWLRGIRRITAERDIPLIIDEMQTGFGRTGTMFAFEAAGIEPDAIVASTAVGGAYPLSLVAYHRRYDVWSPDAHAGTSRGDDVALVAGAETLKVIAEERLVAEARFKGRRLDRDLNALARRHRVVGGVRGHGLMWGVEIIDPDGPADALSGRPPDGARAGRIRRHCLDNGLIIELGGRHGAVIRLLPPLTVTDEELDEMVTILDIAIAIAASADG